MKAVQRMISAWHRFFFSTFVRMFVLFGCKSSLHTVILNCAEPGGPQAMPRSHLAAARLA